MTASQQYKNSFLQFAQEAASGTGIFPETILAVSFLESSRGQSELARLHNNFFGIKAGSSWKGKTVTYPTKEQDKNGKVFTVNAAFRKYDSPADSFRNYVKLVTNPYYTKYGVNTAGTPQEQFRRLQSAGYATDVKYSSKLSDILNALNNIKKTVTENPGISTATVAAFFFSLI